jgi:hypothetical protein
VLNNAFSAPKLHVPGTECLVVHHALGDLRQLLIGHLFFLKRLCEQADSAGQPERLN